MVQFSAQYFIIQFINLNQPDKVAALIEVFMHVLQLHARGPDIRDN